MKEEDILLVAQLLRTLHELSVLLTKAYDSKDSEKLIEIKKEMLATQARLRNII